MSTQPKLSSTSSEMEWVFTAAARALLNTMRASRKPPQRDEQQQDSHEETLNAETA